MKQKKSIKIRPLGSILLDMEPLIQEAMDSHDLQWGDMFGVIHHYLMIHYPGSQEEYEDGTKPVYFYGHKDFFKKFIKSKGKK
jgi:hypothetical protein